MLGNIENDKIFRKTWENFLKMFSAKITIYRYKGLKCLSLVIKKVGFSRIKILIIKIKSSFFEQRNFFFHFSVLWTFFQTDHFQFLVVSVYI